MVIKAFCVFLFLSWVFNQGTIRYHKRYRNYGWKGFFVSVFLSYILVPGPVFLLWGVGVESLKIIFASTFLLSFFYWLDLSRMIYEILFDEDLKSCNWGFYLFEIIFYYMIIVGIGFYFHNIM